MAINLLPTNIKRQQQAAQLAQGLTKLLGFLAGVTLLLAVVVGVYSFRLGRQASSLEIQIEDEKGRILGLGEIEETARSVEDKSQVLVRVLKGRQRYSLLLEAVADVVPVGMNITDLVTEAPSLPRSPAQADGGVEESDEGGPASPNASQGGPASPNASQGGPASPNASQGGRVSISGEANGYADIAQFLKAATQDPLVEGLFSAASLNSVSLNEQSGRVRFSAALELKGGALGEDIFK